jgi:phage shock protein C
MSLPEGTKRLYRSRDEKMVAGVCGGLAEYFEVDPVIIRLAWLMFAVFGVGIITYILAIIIVPQRPL